MYPVTNFEEPYNKDEELKLMEKAARGIFDFVVGWLKELSERSLTILCGKGNNGGDGFALASLLLDHSYDCTVYYFHTIEGNSPRDLMANAYLKRGGKALYVKSADQISLTNKFVVDSLFGVGFAGQIEGLLADIVKKIDKSFVVSVDMPSGVDLRGRVKGIAVKATKTIALGTFKWGYFYNDGFEYIGDLVFVSLGISVLPEGYFVDKSELSKYPVHTRKSNKYEVGKVAIIGGDYTGAVKLASTSCMRSGIGIVQVFSERRISLPPEVLQVNGDYLSVLLKELPRIDAMLFVGIGQNLSALSCFQEVNCDIPIVVDGEAIWKCKPRRGSILTPHRGELVRLLKVDANIDDQLLFDKGEKFCKQFDTILVCKGAPTVLIFPDRKSHVIAYGSVGMATAGSGDVLAGIIAGIVGQGVSLAEGAILGTLLHGLCGELAVKKHSSYSTIASDITNAMPDILKSIRQKISLGKQH